MDSGVQHIQNIVDIFYRGKYSAHNHYIFPYVIMQERVIDNAEAKLVFCNKEFKHFYGQSSKNPHSLSPFTSNDLVAFATTVLESLTCKESVFMIDGLVRVDLFKNNEGKLVVNELESLDASYEGSNKTSNDETFSFLEMYWEQKIYECIADLFL